MRHQAAMQNQEEQNELQGGNNGYNGNNGKKNSPRPFIQPDDPHLLLKEFALLPIVV